MPITDHPCTLATAKLTLQNAHRIYEHGTVFSHTLMVRSKLNRTQYIFQTIHYKPNTTFAVSIQANKANSQPLFIFQYISAKYSAVSLCNLVTCICLML